MQERRRAQEQRVQERVAEGIGEEQLRGREHAVLARDAEHTFTVPAAGQQIAVHVDGRARRTRGSRRVEPEGHVLVADGLGRELPRRLARGVGHHELAAGQRRQQRAQHARRGGVGDHHARPAVGQRRRRALGSQTRVEGHGDGADAEGAEERGRPVQAIRQEDGHALLGLDAEAAERVAEATGPREEIRIAGAARGRDDHGPRTVAGGHVVVEKRGHRVRHLSSASGSPSSRSPARTRRCDR